MMGRIRSAMLPGSGDVLDLGENRVVAREARRAYRELRLMGVSRQRARGLVFHLIWLGTLDGVHYVSSSDAWPVKQVDVASFEHNLAKVVAAEERWYALHDGWVA